MKRWGSVERSRSRVINKFSSCGRGDKVQHERATPYKGTIDYLVLMARQQLPVLLKSIQSLDLVLESHFLTGRILEKPELRQVIVNPKKLAKEVSSSKDRLTILR